MLRNPGHLISAGMVACEPVPGPFSICEWVRAEQAGGPRLESSQRACVCVHTVDAHSMPIYHMADCCRVHLRGSHDSHAARTGLRLPAGSRSRTSHANLVEMRLMERPGFMDQAHAP
jgi:hypothetical protein